MNISKHLEYDCEILISDQHLLDNTIDRLQQTFANYPQIKFFMSNQELNWVENINLLVKNSGGEFIRILPHDDSSDWQSTNALYQAIQSSPKAIMSYGQILAYDLEGTRLPEKDENTNLNAIHRKTGNHNIEGIELFWCGYHLGAFKGLVRRSFIEQYQLEIITTPTLIHSERLWLAALRLIGDFVFIDREILHKRYYQDSTHRQWNIIPQSKIDSATILDQYIQKLLADDKIEAATKSNWYYCHNNFIKQRKPTRRFSPPWQYIESTNSVR